MYLESTKHELCERTHDGFDAKQLRTIHWISTKLDDSHVINFKQ